LVRFLECLDLDVKLSATVAERKKAAKEPGQLNEEGTALVA